MDKGFENMSLSLTSKYTEILTECEKCPYHYSRAELPECPHNFRDKLSQQLAGQEEMKMEELVEKCMPTLERFEEVEKQVFYPIPKPAEFSATIRIYASTMSREAVGKTLALYPDEQEIRKQERERAVDKCFDYFCEIVLSDRVITNLEDQLQMQRQTFKKV